jgi:hypothetical protein
MARTSARQRKHALRVRVAIGVIVDLEVLVDVGAEVVAVRAVLVRAAAVEIVAAGKQHQQEQERATVRRGFHLF